MHIVLANRWYPPISNGGVAVYDYNLAHALVKLGHRVTVVAARWSVETPALTDDNGVQVHRILAKQYDRLHRVPFFGRYMRSLLQMHYSIQVARKLNQLQEQPDVIEFAEVNAEGWAYLHQRKRQPVIVRCHTPTFVLRDYYHPQEANYDTTITTWMEKACIRRADALTAPSRDMAVTVAGIMGFSAEKFTIIPNPLDVSAFAVDHSRRDLNHVTVLHVGRLDRTKGIEILARAIPKVVAQFPHTYFVYVGSDRPDGQGSTWQTRLSTFFKKEGVGENVLFAGSVDHETLLDWYAKADIAVVPSMLYESFSYTCAQAMAAELPIVCTDIGGIPETVGDVGCIVSTGNVEQLATALCHLVQEQSLRFSLGKQAVTHMFNTCDAFLVGQQTEQFYQSISAEGL